MPHNINPDEISQSIFILQNLCLASHSFCQKYQVNEYSESDQEFNWDYYYGWLRLLVSEHLLQCAIKIRVIEDIVRENNQEVNFEEIGKNAQIDLVLGNLYGDKNILTVREACNKIIHALEFSVVFTPIDHNQHQDQGPHFWSGIVILRGKKKKAKWELHLCVEKFCIALCRFLSDIEHYIDSWHAYKWNY